MPCTWIGYARLVRGLKTSIIHESQVNISMTFCREALYVRNYTITIAVGH